MANQLNLKITGLYTLPNNLSEVPQGALEVANNIVIDDDSIAASRRGHARFPDKDHPVGSDIKQMFNFGNDLLVHYGTTIARYDEQNTQWVDYSGSFESPSNDVRIRSIQLNNNVYITSGSGVQRLDALTNQWVDAGTPRALDIEGTTTGTGGFLQADSAVAYRLIWVLEDANGNRIAGAPSERAIIQNTSGNSVDAQLTFSIPDGITTDYTFELYRSAQSGSASSTPDDELQLVAEGSPNSTDISNGEMTVTDSTPDSLRGADLYTNPSQQGISQANTIPPYSTDMTQFKEWTLYANTRRKHRKTINLLSVGTSGLQTGDSITIAGTTYTGASAENVSNDEFLVDTSGTASANIESTAKSLIRVINKTSSQNQVYAFYVSGFAEFPGQILIEERQIGGNQFTITAASGGNSWSPTLPTSGNDVHSDNEQKENRVYYSKPRQPDAVPLVNWIDVGQSTFGIKRILALRESIFVFKEDGIFRMTGGAQVFNVESFDPTVAIRGPESAVTHTNRIFCFSNQAVIAVSDTSGVQIISRPIERQLLQLSAQDNFAPNTFAVSYESDRKYILFTISNDSDTTATQAYVYNSLTRSWTIWDIERTTGLINNADDQLYTGGTNNYIYRERKNRDRTDYADDQYQVTINSQPSDNVLTLGSGDEFSQIAEGMLLKQDAREAIIQSIDGQDVTVDKTFNWNTGATADAYTPIEVELRFAPMFGDSPQYLKHFSEATFFFDETLFEQVDVRFSTNFLSDSSAIVTSLGVLPGGAWGTFPWGSLPWGTSLGAGNTALRTFVPLDARRANWLNVSVLNDQPFTSFSLTGVALLMDYTSSRIK